VRERPDIVHTHTAKAGTAGRLAGFLYRWFTPAVLIGRPRSCRFVHTYHGHIFHGYYGERKTRAFLFIEKMLAKLATDRIVVLSEQQRREIHEAFGVGRADQFAVVPLGMDTSEFSGPTADHQALRNELGLGPDELLVGIVGRLTEIKNHELFLQAAAIFKNQPSGIEARFLIVGDGALRESLEQQAAKLGLGSDVIFTGSRRDLKNVYQALDIVALTSRNEGTPLTLIEAMASGCAVISTAVGGVVDLLGQPLEADGPITLCERGISVPPNDAAAFAAGLKKLSGNATLRRELGERGLLFVQSNYSVQRLISDVHSLYADLLRDN
jgi:glycosyltransferase involved in cell wall biosynthesis